MIALRHCNLFIGCWRIVLVDPAGSLTVFIALTGLTATAQIKYDS